jgi:hypothetical protein
MLHALIDPIWQSGKMGRRELYAAIGRDLGREYHTAETRTLEEAREDGVTMLELDKIHCGDNCDCSDNCRESALTWW